MDLACDPCLSVAFPPSPTLMLAHDLRPSSKISRVIIVASLVAPSRCPLTCGAGQNEYNPDPTSGLSLELL